MFILIFLIFKVYCWYFGNETALRCIINLRSFSKDHMLDHMTRENIKSTRFVIKFDTPTPLPPHPPAGYLGNGFEVVQLK